MRRSGLCHILQDILYFGSTTMFSVKVLVELTLPPGSRQASVCVRSQDPSVYPLFFESIQQLLN